MFPIAASSPGPSVPNPWKKTAGGLASVVIVTAAAIAGTTVPVGVACGSVFAVVLLKFLPRLRMHVETQRLKRSVVRSTSGVSNVVAQDGAAPSQTDVLVVHLRGPLTFLSQGQIHAVVERAPWPSHLLLELAGVPFVDAGGINELKYVAEFLELRGTRVVLVGASARTTQALERAEVLARFVGKRVYPSLDEALAVVDGLPGSSPPEPRGVIRTTQLQDE